MGEGKKIFGSVTEADVADAVFKQTTVQLDKRAMTLPEIKVRGRLRGLETLCIPSARNGPDPCCACRSWALTRFCRRSIRR